MPSLSFRGFPSLKWQRVRLKSASRCGADGSPHTGCSAGTDGSAGKVCVHTQATFSRVFSLLLKLLVIYWVLHLQQRSVVQATSQIAKTEPGTQLSVTSLQPVHITQEVSRHSPTVHRWQRTCDVWKSLVLSLNQCVKANKSSQLHFTKCLINVTSDTSRTLQLPYILAQY